MNNGDIVSIVTAAGEFVGRLSENNGDSVVLTKPRMLVMGESGMGFARGICMTGVENPEEATFYNTVILTPTNDQVSDAYVEATTGIALAR